MELKNNNFENDNDISNDFKANDYLVSSQLSIKPHNFKLESKIDEIIQDLEESKRNIQGIKNDFMKNSHLHNEQGNEISRFFLDEINRLSKELKNMNNLQNEECNYLKKQIGYLNQDRIKLTQNLLILDNRVAENEKDVGFKNIYDS